MCSQKENKTWQLAVGFLEERQVLSTYFSNRGVLQGEGLYFTETVASLPNFQPNRCYIAIAAWYGFKLEQIDLGTALSILLLWKKCTSRFHKVLKNQVNLRKSSCSTSIERSSWSQASSHTLERCSQCNGAISELDSLWFWSLYIRQEGKSEFVIIDLHVDDLSLTSNSWDLVSKAQAALKEK